MSQPLQDNICESQLFERLYKKHAKNLHDFLYYKFGEHLNPQDTVISSKITKGNNKFNRSPTDSIFTQ